MELLQFALKEPNLHEQIRLPPEWYLGQLTFLPKPSRPKPPKDLRPILL